MQETLREQVLQDLNVLSEKDLEQVAEYVSFLKFRTRRKKKNIDESELAALYAEFAEEDRELAENGFEDYINGLSEEDAK